MPVRFIMLVSAVLIAAGCRGAEPPSAETTTPTNPPATIDPSHEPNSLMAPELPPGTWREEHGARFCEGYLTRREDLDYCAAEVPGDWEPFEFDGQTYYVQPLTEQPD